MSKDTDQSKQSLIHDVIGCLSESVILEFCLECDKVTPFVNTLKCLYCGCDSPFGEFYDDNINERQMNEYLNKNTISIGKISEIQSLHTVGFLNSL